jgi:ankyrin repeat protein
LHRAISDRRIDVAQRLIEYGADLDRCCYFGDVDAPLHRAVYTNQPQLVELLLEYGAAIDLPDRLGRTPIDIAIKEGNRSMVLFLVDRGAAKSIHVAVAIGDVEAVDRYLQAGGDPDLRAGNYGCSPLHVAAICDRVEIAQILIKAGAQVDLEFRQDDFAILAAARHSCCEMVELLVAHGAQTDVSNLYCGNLVNNAAWGGRTEIIRLAIERYSLAAEGERPYGGNSVQAAAGNGQIATLEFLISQGVSIPDSAIYQAAENGHHDTVKFLANLKIDPNSQYRQEMAIVKAASQGNLAMVQTLLSVGADVNVGADAGTWTALHQAAGKGDLEMVRSLVAAGAKVNAGLKEWQTPLQLAARSRHDEIVDFLIQHGARG